ncbi:antirestriction protein [Hyphomonas polymorpha PS728]|uniref:Antirestriction protein n=1 Tax=Hyphomonas polymorpha PS728 TaxID=1280954 RepID=A0A062VN84_9PROT|nr:antirestriction protein ArdA [Hyphomonas polymorpha]KCZ99691.1 antirestriction protein [Hyphomonas polymorpha PS728]
MTKPTHTHAPETREVTGSGDAPPTQRPRLYVACLAAYNSGILHGRWIDVTTPDEIRGELTAMLAESPVPGAEEWAIHDQEGFEDISLSEYADFDTVCDLASFLAEHGRLGAKLYDHFGGRLDETRAAFDDYAGPYKTAAEFAEEVIRETGTQIPQSLEYYIDWQALARDMALNGEILVFQTGFDEVHIFWSR